MIRQQFGGEDANTELICFDFTFSREEEIVLENIRFPVCYLILWILKVDSSIEVAAPPLLMRR